MSVSEAIVREYFELHGFLVHQRRKFVASNVRDEDEIDFYVLNPQGRRGESPIPFVLAADDLTRLDRAMVVVKGWHSETFSSARLESTPEIFRFVEPAIFRQAARFFGDGGALTKILIVPALPQSEAAREKSVVLLRSKGVDAVIPFRTLLAGLVAGTEPNRNYQKSDLLQVIRIFKNYDFFREPQMELFKLRRTARTAKSKETPPPDAGTPGNE